MIKFLKKIKHLFNEGKRIVNDPYHIDGKNKSILEIEKTPLRSEVINYLLKSLNKSTNYLEIGVRFPHENFDKINSNYKLSVDPGYENSINPVDFKVTSDEFFEKLKSGKILTTDIKFDVIFIDGLHLAEQVERDINNSLNYLSEDGFIVMHDCNPPTIFHASETYQYRLSPSRGYWNGTTWKAFFKFRENSKFYSCCIDSDWGIGVISKNVNLGEAPKVKNPYFEYNIFKKNRKQSLNLISFEEFKSKLFKA